MADKPNRLDVEIEKLLQATPHAGPESKREQDDVYYLGNLNVTTTSGDTLVIMEFLAGDSVNCHNRQWETIEFLMDSQQLLATGSSVFAEKLSPEAQAQARRRLDRDGKSHVNTRYVLNLTPPEEGDVLASQVVQMSLSDGVRNWWQSHYILHISEYLVSGHDDLCPQHIEAILTEHKIEERYNGRDDDTMSIGGLECPPFRQIADYCPVRHRAAILRLLMAIPHGELVLNSAPRVATIAVVAKILDCTKIVADSVLTWLMAEPNQNFVDINTEDALTIAWALKIPDVIFTTFRILVVEKAIEILGGNRVEIAHKPFSIFGRPRGSVGEEPETYIQHAAQRLAQRAEQVLARLRSDDVHMYLGITNFPEDDPILCEKLRRYIHSIVDTAETQAMEFTFTVQYDRNRSRYTSKNDLLPTDQIYLCLSPTQRVLTSYFWRSLSLLASSHHVLDSHFGTPRIELPQPSGSVGSDTKHLAPTTNVKIHDVHSMFVSAINNLESKWVPRKLEVNIPQTGPLALGLSDDEFKFLPLWAGGLDDETGAVFTSDIPDAERSEDAATIATGEGTGTVTNGYSVRATLSHRTGQDHADTELATTAAGLSLTSPQRSRAASVAQEDMTGLPDIDTLISPEDDEWMFDFSDDEDISLEDIEDTDMS
ncbi:hypothetical protein O1611_g4287 [Lasiodiplodia mahajangana]|uniref:Uncharacterized protein n=1 Tax=Lasiodiplodia mahajangana TaxID=1108764 RepID=A0ACC2JPS0_9PEZI|nr:hypothetical protein O1611_g4287 [Lasiodiplodia mahajangana]